MTKTEIVERTLSEISYRQNPPPEEIADCIDIEGYDDFVIATLNELLPAGDIKTCGDLKYFGVKCCHTCHTYYPHLELKLVTLPDGSKAWICCSLRSALLDPEVKVGVSPEYADVEGIFTALLPKVGIVFVYAGCLWVDSTPVDDAIFCDEVLTHDKGHDAYWQELQVCGAVPSDEEYDDVPRGRVSYDTKSRIYHLYLDKCILLNKKMVRKIIRAMKLPSAPLTEIGTDSHYRCPGCMHHPEDEL